MSNFDSGHHYTEDLPLWTTICPIFIETASCDDVSYEKTLAMGSI